MTHRGLVLGKLQPRESPMTETLNSKTLERVLIAFFPEVKEDEPLCPAMTPSLKSYPSSRRSRRRQSNTALGPDGILDRALSLALHVLGSKLKHLFNCCLSSRRIPARWEKVRLVLVSKPKPGLTLCILVDMSLGRDGQTRVEVYYTSLVSLDSLVESLGHRSFHG